MQLDVYIYHSILVSFKENSFVGEPLPAEWQITTVTSKSFICIEYLSRTEWKKMKKNCNITTL